MAKQIVNGIDSRNGSMTLNDSYQPNKSERDARRRIWERYNAMKDDPLRKDAESEWDMADIMYRQWTPIPDPDDWRTNLVLPDAFAGIQSQMQETIDRKSRPIARPVEDSDAALAEFYNAILNHNMDRTDFDLQYFFAKQVAAIRGTSFMYEYYRVDKRKVKDPDSVDAKGKIVYKDKEIIDFDDAYSEQIDNEFIFIDNRVAHIDKAMDMVRREVLDIDEFKRIYSMKPDYLPKNVDKVQKGGDTGQKAFFQMPDDMEKNEVEVIHYINRATDEYNVLANNVIIRTGPLPWKHKELPIAVFYQYYIPGRFFGMGIPKVVYSLTEERRSIRMLNLDRQKMQLNKMVFVNDTVDLDDDELVTRPFGIVNVNTGGLPINSAIMPMEYGDVPASYFRTEEILLEDIRRAHGIDDRIQGNATGGTATEAAILKESSQKRINLVAQLVEMDGLKRLGKLKWANIQFFYPAPRVENIVEDNEDKQKKTYRKISTKGKEFTIVKGDDDKQVLQMNDIAGTSSFQLNKSMARFLDGDDDVTIDVEAHMVMSKPLQQAKITEMFNTLLANPALAPVIDLDKSARRYVEINDEDPKDWLKGGDVDPDQQRLQANFENSIMLAGYPLLGTPGATTDHTEVHIDETNSAQYQEAVRQNPAIEHIFKMHILTEHENNPTTGSAADAMSAGAATAGEDPMADLPGGVPAGGAGGAGGGGPMGGAGGPNNPANQPVTPAVQPADLQPSTAQGSSA